MDQKGLEAVLISTETSTHADLAKKAMERGLVSGPDCFLIPYHLHGQRLDYTTNMPMAQVIHDQLDESTVLTYVACASRKTNLDRLGDE